MLAFLDFEASSLGSRSYPIEVAWVFEDGSGESHLIRPAPDWDDWSAESEAIHGISRATLLAEGEYHTDVANRMVAALTGHRLFASAPSWDGQWLSRLLRAALLPRSTLRLHDTDIARHEAARAVLQGRVPPDRIGIAADNIAALAQLRQRENGTAHRALADARAEWESWRAAAELAQDWRG